MSDLHRILAFLDRIGIAVVAASLPGDTFLPAIEIRDGALRYDPDRLARPGDLLHEAGHVAVTVPEARAALSAVADNPAEEMAAIAWSYAAALAAGVDPASVFHPDGYRDGSDALLAAFESDIGPGTPLLGWYGMTREPGGPPRDAPDFPAMARWLR